MQHEPLLSGVTLTQTIFSLSVLWVIGTVIYRIFFHPLASFPGPFWGKFSEYDSWGSMLKLDRSLKHHRLLRKYGSPLRISTNTLVFADAKSWNDIYGQSSEPCLKHGGLYDALTVTGAPNLVSVTDRHAYVRLRRLLSHSFSEHALLESETLIADKINDYVDYVFASVPPGGTAEILHQTHNHYLDMVSHLSFGKSFNCLKGGYPTAYADLNEFSNVLVPTALFTQTFAPWISFLLTPLLKNNLKGLARLEAFARTATMDYVRLFHEKGADNIPPTFLKNLVVAADPESGTYLSTEELVENAIIFLRAGSSITAVATLYCIWACGKHLAVHQKVVAEIRAAFPDPSQMPSYAAASKLPYLSAVIQEVLRLFGTLNVSLPRVSPGRHIAGHYIPAGTVVQTNPYATARDPAVFPEPDSFRPERWTDPTPAMKAMSRPFSWGPRNCIGKHLAQIGMTLTLARVCQLYDVDVDPRTTDEMMEQKDIGVLEPKGERLYVRVNKARV